MSVLHIIPGNTEITYPFISMIEYELPYSEQHIFLITETKDTVIKKAPLLLASKNAVFITENSFAHSTAQKYFKEASTIIWHSFSGSNSFGPAWLLGNRQLWKKTVWAIWDDELRQLEYHDDVKNNKKFYEAIKAICKHIRIVAQNEFSQLIAKYLLDITDTIYIASYPWEKARIRRVLDYQVNTDRHKQSMRLMQVGYSGFAINYHDKLFPVLNEMNYPFHYIVPMNFNDHQVEKQTSVWYQNFIRGRREKYPNLNIYLLSKQVNQIQYLEYLSRLDGVIVFKYYATCFPLLLYSAIIGFPIFFAESNVVYLALKHKNFPVYLLQDLEQLDNILCKEEKNRMQFNVWARETLNPQFMIETWKVLFNSIL